MRAILFDYVVCEAPAGQFGNVGTVKNTANDTTANYLSSKIAAGSGVSLVTLNGGGNESLQINAGAGGAISAKVAGFNITNADFGKTFLCTGTFAVTFNTAVALGANFSCTILNVGTGVITLTPNAGNGDKILIPGGTSGGSVSTTLPYSGTTSGPYNVSGVTLLGDGANPGILNVVNTTETHGSQIFSANGTFNVPAGVTSVWVTAVGGGGGSGGTSATGASGGAGSGFAASKIQQAVTPGTAIAVTIGQGGAGGVAGTNNGTAGTATTFGGLLTFGGGNFSVGGSAAFGIGGAGGQSGATFAGAGARCLVGSTEIQIGEGGQAPFFGYNRIQTSTITTGSLQTIGGVNGLTPGGGGSGAVSQGGAAAQAGGTGGNGMLIVEW